MNEADRADAVSRLTFAVVDPRSGEATRAVTAYFAELDARFVSGFDPGDAISGDAPLFEEPHGAFVLARVDGETVGCGAVQSLDAEVGEIKRMWVDPAWRGHGIARRLLAHLESVVADLGHGTVRLDTNAVLLEAIRMYERAGYGSIERYNDNPYAERWFEKPLD